MKKTKTPSAAIAALAQPATATPQAIQLFQQGAIDFSKLKATRLNAPRLIKPEDCPIGSTAIGQVVRVAPSPATKVKGRVLWMKTQQGTEFLFSITGTVRQALAGAGLLVVKPIKGEDGETNTVMVDESTKLLEGKILAFTRQPDGRTQNYANAEEKKNGGKRMYMIDVALLEAWPN